MKQLTIAVGTQSEQKLKFLKAVLSDIGLHAKLFSTNAKSKVSNQPLTQEETLQGSLNRANYALAKNPTADFAIGIEVGYHPNLQGKYEMFCCASIVDRYNFAESCYSSRLQLPKFHQNILTKGQYLGKHVHNYSKSIDESATNYLRNFITHRQPLIMEASRNAILMYLKKEDY